MATKTQRAHDRRQQQAAYARARIIDINVGNLTNALMGQGMDVDRARTLSREILSQKGVRLGKRGVYWKGQWYKPDAFATSRLARWATGAAAQARNERVIKGSPDYLNAVASLGLERDTTEAELDAQRRRALLDFGDPAFAGQDQGLAGEIAQNPFSIVKQLALRNEQNQLAARQAANRYGTIFGGGYQSAMEEANRSNAIQQSSATQQLQDLLDAYVRQRSGAEQSYQLGSSQALQQATQNLLASGQIHAATPPSLRFGAFRLYRPPVVMHPRGTKTVTKGGLTGTFHPAPPGAKPKPPAKKDPIKNPPIDFPT